jgi:hypothetical protein
MSATSGLPPVGVLRRAVALLVLLVAAAACVLAALAAAGPAVVPAAALLAVLLVAGAYRHPPLAAYLVLAGTPLLAGLARNGVLPLLRPHEALGLLLGAGVALRAVAQLAGGHPLPLRWTRLDTALALLATAGSLLPLLWMLARGLTPSQQDLLYAAALWKFYGVFLLVRVAVRTERQVARCLWICVGVGVVVAVVAMLESLLPAAAALGDALFPGDPGSGPSLGRGSSTLGSTIAVGDVMAFDLAICLAWAFLQDRRRRTAIALSAVFVLGALASGQFSGVLAVIVVVVAIAVLSGRVVRLIAVAVPAAIVAGLLLWPVIAARLADLDPATGLPQSWGVRLQNLTVYVWPQVFRGWNWLLGVRPTAVVEVPTPYAPQVYIESGHTWLLWSGGVPLVLAYLFFTWVAVRQSARVACGGRTAYAVAGAAGFSAVLVTFVLMTFDPHLTTRGTADLMFSLLGLTAVGAGALDRRREMLA